MKLTLRMVTVMTLMMVTVMTLMVMKMVTKWFWRTMVTGGPPERATDGSCVLNNAQHPIFMVTMMLMMIIMVVVVMIMLGTSDKADDKMVLPPEERATDGLCVCSTTNLYGDGDDSKFTQLNLITNFNFHHQSRIVLCNIDDRQK